MSLRFSMSSLMWVILCIACFLGGITWQNLRSHSSRLEPIALTVGDATVIDSQNHVDMVWIINGVGQNVIDWERTAPKEVTIVALSPGVVWVKIQSGRRPFRKYVVYKVEVSESDKPL